jgi:hypothetical protein
LNGWIAKAVNIDALSATAISRSILFIEGVSPYPIIPPLLVGVKIYLEVRSPPMTALPI